MSLWRTDSHDQLDYLVSEHIFSKSHALKRAINRKDSYAIEILCRVFTCTKKTLCKDRGPDRISLLRDILETCNIDTVKFFLDTFDDINKQDVLNAVDLYFQDLEFMIFLLGRFDFCGRELFCTFKSAVRYGDVPLLKHLFDKHPQLSPDYDGLMQTAVTHGQVEALCLLGSHYESTVGRPCPASDLVGHNNAVLIEAIIRGHIDMIKCLHTKFGLSADALLKPWNSGPVFKAAEYKRMDMLRYFFDDMALNRDRISAHNITFAWGGRKQDIEEFLVLRGYKW